MGMKTQIKGLKPGKSGNFRSRKGMVYTTFAIIATSLLILLFAFTSTSQDYTGDENPFRIGEASYYLKNIEGDLSRAHQIAARRAASSVVNYTVRNGEPVEGLEQTLENITLNGSTERFDTVVKDSSLNSWKQSVKDSAEESRYVLSIQFDQVTFEDSGIGLETTVQASTQLEDPTTATQFNNTPERTNTVDFEGYEDTLFLLRSGDTYINNYKRCGFQDPAQQVATGTDSNTGATYGEATTDTTASDREEKILVNNEPSNGGDFAGVITDDSVSYNNTKYITGLDAENLNIEEGQNLILYEDQIWHSQIREIINTGCYLRSEFEQDSKTEGPGIKERLKNQTANADDETQGLETLLDKSRLPQQLQYLDRSNVGYRYFRATEGQKIAGITGDQAFNPDRDGYRNGFRLDSEHIEKWNMQGLIY
jgi:hypothetical protein